MTFSPSFLSHCSSLKSSPITSISSIWKQRDSCLCHQSLSPVKPSGGTSEGDLTNQANPTSSDSASSPANIRNSGCE